MFDKIYNILKKEQNIKFWEYREDNISVNSLSAWNGDIKKIESGVKQGNSFRVLFGNGWGFVYSDKKDIEKSVKNAIRIAKAMGKHNKEKKEVYIAKQIKKKVKSKFKINNEDIELKEKKDLVINNSIVKNKNIKNCMVSYNDIDKIKSYVNSEGSEIQQKLRYTMTGINVTSRKNNRMENFFERHGELAGYEVTQDLNRMLNNSIKKSIDMLDSKIPKSGNMPVICDGALTDVFIHEALGHAAEADHLLQNSSCLKGLGGKSIAPETVNIYDDATMPGLWGSYFYDDEGIKAQKTSLIEKGRLTGFMHSRETAAKYESTPTGNARAQSASYIPIVRMSNTYIKKGKDKFEDMVKSIKKGVYLKGSIGGQVDPTTGNFTFSAQEGFEINKGKIEKRLKGVSLSGNTLKILQNIGMISNKYEKSFAGHCGKAGQYVPVYGPCPNILIKKATVGGN